MPAIPTVPQTPPFLPLPKKPRPVSKLTRLLIAAAAAFALAWMATSVAAALTPFILAAVIAYIAAPLAGRIEAKGGSPTVSATVVVILILLTLVLIPMALIPLIAAQAQQLAALLPQISDKLHDTFGGTDAEWLAHIKTNITAAGADGIDRAADLAAALVGGGVSLASSFLGILLITPLSAFYFVRDRQSINGGMTELLPPHIREPALVICREINGVLDEFLHGQLLVMCLMSIFFAVVLKFANLPFALTIGVIAGMLTFIPYLGFIIGLALATLVGIGAFDSFIDLLIVWILMTIGTVLENMLITPKLVGERVGLHPLVVLLAIMTMGELFGTIGVLVALPTAAVLLVCGRHLRRRYIASDLYGNP